jgi:tRNA threonylcarbamoyladenosine biosynthesis protein TsaB
MGVILNLETATKVCSVNLAKDGQLLAVKEFKSDKFSHSENLNLFIQDVMSAADMQFKDLDAVAVSKGPGSYTGLRIGVSTAKGLCYALDIPLISVNSLQALAALKKGVAKYTIPMFDARRMEVYSTVFDEDLNEIEPVKAVVLEKDSYQSFVNKDRTLFLGPGAEKYQNVLKHPNVIFDLQTEVSSIGMVKLSEQKYALKQFEDVAYFEPYYLKEFIAGLPKKMF